MQIFIFRQKKVTFLRFDNGKKSVYDFDYLNFEMSKYSIVFFDLIFFVILERILRFFGTQKSIFLFFELFFDHRPENVVKLSNQKYFTIYAQKGGKIINYGNDSGVIISIIYLLFRLLKFWIFWLAIFDYWNFRPLIFRHFEFSIFGIFSHRNFRPLVVSIFKISIIVISDLWDYSNVQ